MGEEREGREGRARSFHKGDAPQAMHQALVLPLVRKKVNEEGPLGAIHGHPTYPWALLSL